MTDDPRIQELLDELLDAQSTPEEVCRSCPDLLSVVRKRRRRLRRLRADLDDLFPSSGKRTPQPLDDTALPLFPGHDVTAVREILWTLNRNPVRPQNGPAESDSLFTAL
jgi:serine/threonine-protein kinase